MRVLGGAGAALCAGLMRIGILRSRVLKWTWVRVLKQVLLVLVQGSSSTRMLALV